MKIIGISGNSRIESNTEVLVKEASEGAKQNERGMSSWPMTSQTKAFDRTYLLSNLRKKLKGKVGGVIAICGQAGHEFTAAALMDHMTLRGIILPPKAFAHSYARGLGAVRSDENRLKKAMALGERVVSPAPAAPDQVRRNC